MNDNDLKVALTFLFACDYDYIVLQCNKAQDIPYIKRALIQELGQPSKMLTHSLYYSGKCIRIVPLSAGAEAITGVRQERLFYVPYKDDSDWQEHCAYGFRKQQLVPYDMYPWLNEGDILMLLMRDGMSREEAIHKMACDEL